MTQQEYKKKTELLKRMAHHYYVLDSPIATDDEYDKLYHQLVDVEHSHPEYIDKTSPTQRVGGEVLTTFIKSQHLERMWSLENVFNIEELKSWVNRLKTLLGNNLTFMCDVKLDGASLNLHYQNGKLVSASTRGDGLVGELITANVITIKNIPLEISYVGDIEIRGEVVINKTDFENLNQSRLRDNLPLFANPRNAASGSLRQLDTKTTASRKLKFIPWGFGFNTMEEDSFNHMLDIIKTLGFTDLKLTKLCTTVEEIEEYYKYIISIRDTYPIMLDGMVVRLDSIKQQNILGYTTKFPKYAVAYKFPAIEKQTKIKDIIFQVGRTGVITPVAILDPINIEGAEVTRCTLHNFEEIERKDIRIGDTVIIIRSGDVIPKIIKPITELRSGNESKVTPPTLCPTCKKTLFKDKAYLKCQNLSCEDIVINSIIHFGKRKCMNIDGLGESAVADLVDYGKVKNISDLYDLQQDDLQDMYGWGDKKINNLLDAIAKTKDIELWRFIHALGIEHIGEVASKKLSSTLGYDVFLADYDTLSSIDGIGHESAHAIIDFISNNEDIIVKLIHVVQPSLDVKSVGDLTGQVIVLTGTLSKSRDAISQELVARGAEVSNTITNKTTLVIYGENAGSKLTKAQELNIKTLTENEFNLNKWR